MPFFYLDDETEALQVSPTFWIWFAVAAPLTAITLGYWRLSLRWKRKKQSLANKKLNADLA